jgi:hypothetical protein
MFNIDWWNQIQATATDGPLTADYLQAGAVTEPALGTCAVTQDKLGALSVTSCKLSTNALTRVLVIPFSKLASTETGSLLSSTNIIYQPTVPINITGVQVFPTGAWNNATCDHFTFYRNSSSCVANVGFKSIASTASLWGVASCVGSITNAQVAAGTVLTMKSNVSTCSVSSNANIVVHYTSTS